MRNLACLVLLSWIVLPVFSQKDAVWDVYNPPGDSSFAEFSVSEGTWMNLDVSPDGKQIVFDLLGDIYIMPVTGGTAEALRTGLPYEVQPRFSPDGKFISFTSDAGGADNIWVMDIDGKNARQVTREDFRLLNNAVWTPDGQYLIARKHFTSTRSAGAGELWMYHITGGSGFQLTKRKNDQQDVGEPWVSADGNSVYFSEDMYPGGYFQYNKDPNSQIYIIRKYDRLKGEVENVISGSGGAFRPVLSHDGKKMAFVRRIREKTVLYLHDMATNTQKPLYDSLSKDQQEAWALFGVYSNFNFTPDDQSIIIWSQGKIRKIDIHTGTATVIPFTAPVKQKLMNALRFNQEVAPDSFTVKAIRQAITSPDGKYLVFNAAGYLWKKELPSGIPQRITNGTDLEFEPAFSPEGAQLVFVTWNDETMGNIRILDWKKCAAVAKTCATPASITKEMGIYRTPKFSPDGKTIVFQKEGGNGHMGYAYTNEPGIYTIKTDGTGMKLVTKEGDNPYFTADGSGLFYQTGGYLFGGFDKGFHRVDLDGNHKTSFFSSKYANQFVPSPDNKWLAFTELYKVYIIPMPQVGKSIDLTGDIKSIPVSCVAKDAGIGLHWSNNSQTLHWTLGEEYFSVELKNRFAFLEGAPDSLPPLDTVGIRIGLKLPTDKPKGTIALTNARVITMEGNQVLENTTLIITDNRITAIGNASEISIPAGAKKVDCTGKTIMPGFVDVHAHTGNFRFGLSPQKQWEYYANLAFGVTTTHDPSTNSEMVFSQSEMLKAGYMTGPRLYSTGTILYGADGDFKAVVNSLEDARMAIRRTKAFGAFSVKSYNQPRRNQRQQVITAAMEDSIMVVPEGGSHFFHNMSMILDGHTGIEHNIPVATLYEDVIKLWSRTKSGNTPTLIVSYGSVSGEYYWFQKTNVWENQKLLNFTPRAVVDSRSRHRVMIPDQEYENGHILVSRSLKKLTDAGVKINMGSHGQIQGIGAHWEIWMLQQGGMTNMEALQAATINGANYIGLDNDLGSISTGKLADLLILDKNPLDDIQNTQYIQYVMLNGRLYDPLTMNETISQEKKRSRFFWERDGFNENFPFQEGSCTFEHGGCVCH